MGHVRAEDDPILADELQHLRQQRVLHLGAEEEVSPAHILRGRHGGPGRGLRNRFAESGGEAEAVLQPVHEKVDPEAARFQKCYPEGREAVQHPAGDHRGEPHEQRHQERNDGAGVEVVVHVAQRRAGPTHVNGQRQVLLRQGFVEGEEAPVVQGAVAHGAEDHHRHRSQPLGFAHLLHRGRDVVQIHHRGPVELVRGAGRVREPAVVGGAQGRAEVGVGHQRVDEEEARIDDLHPEVLVGHVLEAGFRMTDLDALDAFRLGRGIEGALPLVVGRRSHVVAAASEQAGVDLILHPPVKPPFRIDDLRLALAVGRVEVGVTEGGRRFFHVGVGVDYDHSRVLPFQVDRAAARIEDT